MSDDTEKIKHMERKMKLVLHLKTIGDYCAAENLPVLVMGDATRFEEEDDHEIIYLGANDFEVVGPFVQHLIGMMSAIHGISPDEALKRLLDAATETDDSDNHMSLYQ